MEHRLTLGETLFWAGVFFGGMMLFFVVLPYLLMPLFWLFDYFYQIPPPTSD